MRLSDAIRLGAMLKPQAYGGFHFEGRTCAMGAALDACGRLDAVEVADARSPASDHPSGDDRVKACSSV